MASLLSSPDSPQHIFSCMESMCSECEQNGLARSALEALFQIDSNDPSAKLDSKPEECGTPSGRSSSGGSPSAGSPSAGSPSGELADSDRKDEEQHCQWLVASLCAALPLLKDVLPRDQCGTCVVPHHHPLQKIVLDDSRRLVSRTGVTFYRTSRVCDNCDGQIIEKEYWSCGHSKPSGGACSVDFCCNCYDEMQKLFAACSMENAMWVVRFINAVAKHVVVHMPPSSRQLLLRQLAFEFPLAMFESIVRVVVDVTDASVVHIEDNITNVKEFEDFWYTLGFLDLLHVANVLPTTERRVGQVFVEGARLPTKHFVLQGIDKCEVYSDWVRWKRSIEVALDEQSDILTSSEFSINDNFTCFLSHSHFVPRAFLRKAVEYDTNSEFTLGPLEWRELSFRRDPDAFREDVIINLGLCFESGQRVRLGGLKNAPDLNGKEGQLDNFLPQKGRWSVKIGEDGEAKSLKPCNLEHIDEEERISTMKKPIDPRFAGENGAGPGVMREFFLLALQSLISRTEFWEYNEEVRTYWFSGSTSLDAVAASRAVGLIVGNAIRMDLLLPAVFPDPLHALLLRSLGSSAAGKWSLADLRKVSPNFARSFEQFIEYDKDDAASLFTLDWPRGDELETLPKAARSDYVQAYVDWFFNERFAGQANALVQGFKATVGHSKMLQNLVSVEQFGQILNGVEDPVDIVAIRRKASEIGWSSDAEKAYLEKFWNTVESFSEEQRRKFAVFVSSSARAPLKGWSDFGLHVQKNGTGDERLPTAYTCFHMLLLPMYTSTELLRTRLLHAIDETQGFGLY